MGAFDEALNSKKPTAEPKVSAFDAALAVEPTTSEQPAVEEPSMLSKAMSAIDDKASSMAGGVATAGMDVLEAPWVARDMYRAGREFTSKLAHKYMPDTMEFIDEVENSDAFKTANKIGMMTSPLNAFTKQLIPEMLPEKRPYTGQEAFGIGDMVEKATARVTPQGENALNDAAFTAGEFFIPSKSKLDALATLGAVGGEWGGGLFDNEEGDNTGADKGKLAGFFATMLGGGWVKNAKKQFLSDDPTDTADFIQELTELSPSELTDVLRQHKPINPKENLTAVLPDSVEVAKLVKGAANHPKAKGTLLENANAVERELIENVNDTSGGLPIGADAASVDARNAGIAESKANAKEIADAEVADAGGDAVGGLGAGIDKQYLRDLEKAKLNLKRANEAADKAEAAAKAERELSTDSLRTVAHEAEAKAAKKEVEAYEQVVEGIEAKHKTDLETLGESKDATVSRAEGRAKTAKKARDVTLERGEKATDVVQSRKEKRAETAETVTKTAAAKKGQVATDAANTKKAEDLAAVDEELAGGIAKGEETLRTALDAAVVKAEKTAANAEKTLGKKTKNAARDVARANAAASAAKGDTVTSLEAARAESVEASKAAEKAKNAEAAANAAVKKATGADELKVLREEAKTAKAAADKAANKAKTANKAVASANNPSAISEDALKNLEARKAADYKAKVEPKYDEFYRENGGLALRYSTEKTAIPKAVKSAKSALRNNTYDEMLDEFTGMRDVLEDHTGTDSFMHRNPKDIRDAISAAKSTLRSRPHLYEKKFVDVQMKKILDALDTTIEALPSGGLYKDARREYADHMTSYGQKGTLMGDARGKAKKKDQSFTFLNNLLKKGDEGAESVAAIKRAGIGFDEVAAYMKAKIAKGASPEALRKDYHELFAEMPTLSKQLDDIGVTGAASKEASNASGAASAARDSKKASTSAANKTEAAKVTTAKKDNAQTRRDDIEAAAATVNKQTEAAEKARQRKATTAEQKSKDNVADAQEIYDETLQGGSKTKAADMNTAEDKALATLEETQAVAKASREKALNRATAKLEKAKAEEAAERLNASDIRKASNKLAVEDAAANLEKVKTRHSDAEKVANDALTDSINAANASHTKGVSDLGSAKSKALSDAGSANVKNKAHIEASAIDEINKANDALKEANNKALRDSSSKSGVRNQKHEDKLEDLKTKRDNAIADAVGKAATAPKGTIHAYAKNPNETVKAILGKEGTHEAMKVLSTKLADAKGGAEKLKGQVVSEVMKKIATGNDGKFILTNGSITEFAKMRETLVEGGILTKKEADNIAERIQTHVTSKRMMKKVEGVDVTASMDALADSIGLVAAGRLSKPIAKITAAPALMLTGALRRFVTGTIKDSKKNTARVQQLEELLAKPEKLLEYVEKSAKGKSLREKEALIRRILVSGDISRYIESTDEEKDK